jgi:ABC-type uncharacterized transport system fused permease/ATPase subunit
MVVVIRVCLVLMYSYYLNIVVVLFSEEIAFYQGNLREKVTIESTFGRLVKIILND